MSTSSLQQNTPAEPPSHQRRLRWFGVVILTVWTLLSLTVPAVIFWITRNPASLSLFSLLAPPALLWHRLWGFLFPPPPLDERRYQLKLARTRTMAALLSRRQNKTGAHN